MLQDLANGIAAIGAWFADPPTGAATTASPTGWSSTSSCALLSMVAALLVALPIGLYIGHTGRFSFISVQLANIGRAVPSYAVMALLFPLSIAFSRAGASGGLAYFATFAAMVLLAVPARRHHHLCGHERGRRRPARGSPGHGHARQPGPAPGGAAAGPAGGPHRRPHRIGPGHRHGNPGRGLRRRRPWVLHHPGLCPAGLRPGSGRACSWWPSWPSARSCCSHGWSGDRTGERPAASSRPTSTDRAADYTAQRAAVRPAALNAARQSRELSSPICNVGETATA